MRLVASFGLLLSLVASTQIASAQGSQASTTNQENSGTAATQRKPASTKTSSSQWLRRARELREQLDGDRHDLTFRQDILLDAQLCVAWHKVNPREAKGACEGAIEHIEFVPQNEPKEHHNDRLFAAQNVLDLLAAVDPQYRKRLIAALQAFAEGNENDRWIVSDALSSTSTSLIEDDPSAAVEMGSEALKFGGGQEIGRLIAQLRDQDPTKADALLGDAIARVHSDSKDSARLLFSLVQEEFPAGAGLPKQMRAPEELRSQLLDAFSAYLTKEPETDQERQMRCGMAQQAARMAKEFSAEQHGLLQSLTNSCRQASDPAHDYVEAVASSQKRVSSDDFLAAAAMTSDPKIRAGLLSSAIIATESEKSPGRALEIMEMFPEGERDPRWYVSIATNEVYRRIFRNDWSGALNIIDRFSSSDRLHLEMAAAQASLSKNDQSGALLLLGRATRDLQEAKVKDAMVYVQYLNLCLRLQPADAPAVLHRTVKALNDYKPSEADLKRGIMRRPIGDDLGVYLSPAALDVDPQIMDAAVSELESTATRDAFRLALLNAAIERHLKDRQREQMKPAPSLVPAM